MTALLFTVENVWVLEPTTPGLSRQFNTARAARAWAKAHRVTVRRATNCDSR